MVFDFGVLSGRSHPVQHNSPQPCDISCHRSAHHHPPPLFFPYQILSKHSHSKKKTNSNRSSLAQPGSLKTSLHQTTLVPSASLATLVWETARTVLMTPTGLLLLHIRPMAGARATNQDAPAEVGVRGLERVVTGGKSCQ